jgi:hypothetical protein
VGWKVGGKNCRHFIAKNVMSKPVVALQEISNFQRHLYLPLHPAFPNDIEFMSTLKNGIT